MSDMLYPEATQYYAEKGIPHPCNGCYGCYHILFNVGICSQPDRIDAYKITSEKVINYKREKAKGEA